MAPRLSQTTVDKITALAARGLTHAKIAKQTGLTPGAVGSALWRHGVSTKTHKAKPRKPPVKAKVAAAVVAPVKTTKAVVVPMVGMRDLPIETSGFSCSWSDHDDKVMCNWPVGNDRWCRETKGTGPYCDRHHMRAIRIVEPAAGRAQKPQYRVSRGR